VKAIDVPGFGRLELETLVLDFNGTIGVDGELIRGIAGRLAALSSEMRVVVVTADTHGGARYRLAGVPCEVVVIGAGDQAEAKADVLRRLGPARAAVIGNGRNDAVMLREAALGIAVVDVEGAASEAIQAADLVCNGILRALDLLARPKRLVATLRA